MNLVFSPQSWEEYLYWQEADPQMVKRIHQLIRDITRDPYRGIGKPELLKHTLRAATVVAKTPMRLLVLDAREMNALLHEDKKVAERVQENLTRHLEGR